MAFTAQFRFHRRRQSVVRRSALKSTPLRLEVSGPPATAAAAAVPFAAVAIPFAAAAIPFAAVSINVWFGLVAGRAGPLPALTLTLTFCGSCGSPDSGAVPGGLRSSRDGLARTF